METAGGILTARSCVLASLECSQNSVFKRKQNKEDKEKKNARRWTRGASGGWWEIKIEKIESFGSPSNPAFLNDKRRCLQISDRQRRGRDIIAWNSKAYRLRRLYNDLYNCLSFQAGISQRKIVLHGILGQLSGSTFVWCGGEGNRIPKPQVQCFAPSDPTPCTLLITLKKLQK